MATKALLVRLEAKLDAFQIPELPLVADLVLGPQSLHQVQALARPTACLLTSRGNRIYGVASAAA